jgi:hypothetical protein|tara:strand:+ start:359 stop:532 length:174 start_codon:yes stop_codon:yes gene_type:complete
MYKTLIKYTENDKVETFDVTNEINTTEKASVDNVVNQYLLNNLTIANLLAIETFEVA